jgi:dTDP-4-dehydrorhamnose 3,5-epimerase
MARAVEHPYQSGKVNGPSIRAESVPDGALVAAQLAPGAQPERSPDAATRSYGAGGIQGVELKPLKVWPDDRGYLMEVLRSDDPFFRGFGQTTYTVAYPGTIKAFHWHRHQDDIWFMLGGMAQVVLHDLRDDSPTRGQTDVHYLGEQHRALLVIPPGVAHGYRVLGNEPALLLYHTTRPYDPKDPDEERIPFDDPAIGFNWCTRMR